MLTRSDFKVLQYGNSPYLQDFGIDVNPNPMLVQGRLLPAPTLVYTGSEEKPREGSWNMHNKKLYRPAFIDGCVVINYDRSLSQQNLDDAIKGLEAECQKLGIQGMTRQVPILSKDPLSTPYANVRYLVLAFMVMDLMSFLPFPKHLREVGRLHKEELGSFPKLVLVILPERGADDVYKRVKKYVSPIFDRAVLTSDVVSAGDIVVGVATQCLRVSNDE